ncbi:MAG: hypothetical protein L0Y54_17450 [Sporichthyaceae bacterium]|nr:hypothetical protein [Sporichthyaceae bacterium]
MPDASNPAAVADRVRAAADALKQAIDRHLAAVEARTGESDPAVQVAYTELHDVAAQYDDLLFECHDEVTPFVFADGPEEEPEPDGYDEEAEGPPQWISIASRWNLEVADVDVLLDAGALAYLATHPGTTHQDAEEDASTVSRALNHLLDAYGERGLVERAEDCGLRPRGSTSWLLAAKPVIGEDWMDAPFDDIDPDDLMYRIDELYSTDA